MAGASAAAESGWARGAASDGAWMSIGEVLAQLRADFPDTTISKLRFLEAEGLVQPRRTPSGYRKYSPDDLARLRYVLTAQRDYYLPLRVIREQLAAADRGEPCDATEYLGGTGRSSPGERADGDPRGGSSERVTPAMLRPSLTAVGDQPVAREHRETDGWLTRTEVLARTGLDEALLRELEQYGLVTARNGGRYDADALEVASAAAQLAEYGVQPRHLRAYRAAADREIGLFGQLIAPMARQSGPAARARAAEAVRELTGLTERIHAALVRAGLRETLGR